jgi:hypothetical protein
VLSAVAVTTSTTYIALMAAAVGLTHDGY